MDGKSLVGLSHHEAVDILRTMGDTATVVIERLVNGSPSLDDLTAVKPGSDATQVENSGDSKNAKSVNDKKYVVCQVLEDGTEVEYSLLLTCWPFQLYLTNIGSCTKYSLALVFLDIISF